jgi:hypothetical protein
MDQPGDTAEQFLRAVRYDEPTEAFERQLAAIDPDDLARRLDSDAARLTFWVNVYNATIQRALAESPDRYENKRAFFDAKLLTVAGKTVSPDDIEHEILRRSYHPYSLGYLRNPLREEFFVQQSVSERDPRIHFALNCGAESCPPIAAYSRDRIDEQLDWATEGYLDNTVSYDPDGGLLGRGRVVVPRVMLWYRGDFGGKTGILDFLRRYDQIPADARPRLSHRDWDWSLRRGKFADSEAQADGDEPTEPRPGEA